MFVRRDLSLEKRRNTNVTLLHLKCTFYTKRFRCASGSVLESQMMSHDHTIKCTLFCPVQNLS